MKRRVAIVCGGTAGHIHPALSVGDAYREVSRETEILFIGTPTGLESTLVPARGYRLELIPGDPLAREPLVDKLRALARLTAGIVAARRELVMTNRWLARLADRVYFAFDRTAAGFPESRALVTGNPVRREIVGLAQKIGARSPPSHPTVRFFVTGGSGGSNFLNRETPALLSEVASCGVRPEALHQAGAFPLAPIRAAYDRCGVTASVTDYIKDMESAYDWADFVVTSAGSPPLTELAIGGLPFLAVPLSSAAAGHQVANAEACAEACAALWTAENGWDAARLAREIIAKMRSERPREPGGI